MAIATQGILVSVETTPGGGTYTPIGEVVSFDGPTASKPEIETTHLQSTAKEYIAGLPDAGTITLAANFTEPEDAGQAILRLNFEATSAPSIKFQITVASTVYDFDGFVSESPISAQTDSKVDQGYTIRITSGFART